VAVSYLIIIGDLMPQVVGSIFPGSKSMPFLLDRQFWITSFMYMCPRVFG
jgi:amino acid permease